MSGSQGGSWDRARALRWQVLDRAGWEYLLPYAPGARWLCVDRAGGATAALLAWAGARVTAIAATPAERRAMADRFEAMGGVDVRIVDWTGAGEGRYDGLVVHDVGGTLARVELERTLALGGPLLRAGAFTYIALPNRYGYGRARGGWREYLPGRARHYFRPGDLRLAAPSAVHPLLLAEDCRIVDVITQSGYRSAQNPSRLSERLRRALLGPRGAALIAPAFAALSTGPGTPPSTLARALHALSQRRGHPAPGFTARRYRCLRGGKVFVSAASEAGPEGFILVFARAPEAIARRRHEFALLQRLRALSSAVAPFVPQPEFREEVAGAELFVLQEFPGVTLEAAVPALQPATEQGIVFITNLHRETARTERLDAPRVEALCGGTFDAALDRYPPLVHLLREVRGAVLAALSGLEVPVVWFHGDFKVENLVVDRATSRLSGVIDWEHSNPAGLPLLDLWYLLLYNRWIREGASFFEAVQALVAGRLSAAEADACQRYARELRVPRQALAPLAAVLLVHHIGVRVFHDSADAGSMARIAAALQAARDAIAAPQ